MEMELKLKSGRIIYPEIEFTTDWRLLPVGDGSTCENVRVVTRITHASNEYYNNTNIQITDYIQRKFSYLAEYYNQSVAFIPYIQ